MMRKLICWLRGHRWETTAVNPRKAFNLCHLHLLAGHKAYCLRCGEQWDDLGSPYFADEVIELPCSPASLPHARVVDR